jgi:hypothetical protein
MKDFPMFRLRFTFNGLIMLSLLLILGSKPAYAGASCLTPYCYYLPLIRSPLPVQIIQIETYNWFGEVLRFQGEVMNVSATPVYEVEVEISAYDSSNQLVGTVSGPTVLTTTLPGQLNLFDFISDIPSGSYNLVAEITNFTLANTQVYIAPTIVMTDVQIGFDTTSVNVEIRNDMEFALTNVQGLVWSLDQLSSLPPQLVTNYLAPGATATFTSTLYIGHPYLNFPVRVVVHGISEP